MEEVTVTGNDRPRPVVEVVVLTIIVALMWTMLAFMLYWGRVMKPLAEEICTCELALYEYFTSRELIDARDVERIRRTENKVFACVAEAEYLLAEMRRTGGCAPRARKLLAEATCLNDQVCNQKRRLASQLGACLSGPGYEDEFRSLWNSRQEARAKFSRYGGNTIVYRICPLCSCCILPLAVIITLCSLVDIGACFRTSIPDETIEPTEGSTL